MEGRTVPQKWSKARVKWLRDVVDGVRLSHNRVSTTIDLILAEWNPRTGIKESERDSIIESLQDARIQIDTAIEELEAHDYANS